MTETFLTAFAVLLRIFANPFANVFQKQLTANGEHPLVVNFVTYLLLSVVSLFVAALVRWPTLPADFWIFSVLGGLAGALGNGFLVKALQHGDLSVLGPVNSYKSVVGIVFGIFLLREVPNLWGVAGIVLIIAGSYFVLDTTDERFSWALLKKSDIRFRIWAMILTAVEAVFIKKVILASSATVAFLSWCVFGAVFSFLLLPAYKLKPAKELVKTKWQELGRFLFLVLCIGTMQFSTNYAFGHMPVGYALSLFQLSTIVSVLLGHRFFGERDVRKKLAGSFIMIAGSVLIILMKDR